MRLLLAALLTLVAACGSSLGSEPSAAPMGATPTPSADVAIAYASQARACSEVRFVRWVDFRTIELEGCGQTIVYLWRDGWADVSPGASQEPNAPPGGPVHVRGYYRRDGTYVHPHTRDHPR